MEPTSRRSAPRASRWLMVFMALAVLTPSLYGFGTKFLEFIALYRGDVEGVFAISPILNYLLASTGFLLLFGWAAAHGMFRDIEKPKHTMLATEEALDRAEAEQSIAEIARRLQRRAEITGLNR